MTWPRAVCRDCNIEKARYCRGICRSCYTHRTKAGTLYELPPLGNGGRAALGRPVSDYDHAIVERILGGSWREPATPREKAEVCARWVASGRSLTRLARLTGWRPDRYYRLRDAA